MPYRLYLEQPIQKSEKQAVGHTLLHLVLGFIANRVLGYSNAHILVYLVMSPDLARTLMVPMGKKKEEAQLPYFQSITSIYSWLCCCSDELQSILWFSQILHAQWFEVGIYQPIEVLDRCMSMDEPGSTLYLLLSFLLPSLLPLWPPPFHIWGCTSLRAMPESASRVNTHLQTSSCRHSHKSH